MSLGEIRSFPFGRLALILNRTVEPPRPAFMLPRLEQSATAIDLGTQHPCARVPCKQNGN